MTELDNQEQNSNDNNVSTESPENNKNESAASAQSTESAHNKNNRTSPQGGIQSRDSDRHRTYILAELKKYRWVPLLSTYSGVVLDISEAGVKVAFSGNVDVKPYSHYFVRIPLSPLGISKPRFFECKLEVKWFDQRNFRLGGLFINISDVQKSLLAKMVESVDRSTLAASKQEEAQSA
ncbi:MAG: PilZ domain-containing protein [Proteobacteria bacterium]|nr:PilZ domain-containing protein [Pseudomonadota bacterium]